MYLQVTILTAFNDLSPIIPPVYKAVLKLTRLIILITVLNLIKSLNI